MWMYLINVMLRMLHTTYIFRKDDQVKVFEAVLLPSYDKPNLHQTYRNVEIGNVLFRACCM